MATPRKKTVSDSAEIAEAVGASRCEAVVDVGRHLPVLKLSPVWKLSSLQGMRMEDEVQSLHGTERKMKSCVEAVVAVGDPSKREIEEIRWSQLEDERRLWRKTGGRQWRMKDEGRQWRIQVATPKFEIPSLTDVDRLIRFDRLIPLLTDVDQARLIQPMRELEDRKVESLIWSKSRTRVIAKGLKCNQRLYKHLEVIYEDKFDDWIDGVELFKFLCNDLTEEGLRALEQVKNKSDCKGIEVKSEIVQTSRERNDARAMRSRNGTKWNLFSRDRLPNVNEANVIYEDKFDDWIDGVELFKFLCNDLTNKKRKKEKGKRRKTDQAGFTQTSRSQIPSSPSLLLSQQKQLLT
ncbi:hypothetical protein LXL04_003685 [Taraxacum kok-saghyz]